MPNYFNVKNTTYSTNRLLPLLPVVPLLLLKSKGDMPANHSVLTSNSDQSSPEHPINQSHSLMQSIGTIFSGSNALDILSSVEPYLNNNSQQLVNAIKGFTRSLEALKAYRTTPVSTSENAESSDSLNMMKALSTNFNPDIKNTVSPILNLLSTVKGIQSTAPALQQMFSSNGLAKILSSFSSMLPTEGDSFANIQSEDNNNNNGLMGISEIIRMITTLNAMKAEPLFNTTRSDESETTLLETTTDDDTKLEEINQSDETNASGSLIDMADKLKEMINKK